MAEKKRKENVLYIMHIKVNVSFAIHIIRKH